MISLEGQPGNHFVLSIDQGTSGTSASLFDSKAHCVAMEDVPVETLLPRPGWVEQSPWELLESIHQAFRQLVAKCDLKPGQIVSMGVANQGECLILWDRETGLPLYNMIGWQCVRSGDLCDQMIAQGREAEFRRRTGLPLIPEWPATKFPWALHNIPEVAALLRSGRLAFSQSDSWFLFQLSHGEFLTDHSTASRSGFYNIASQDWDPELMDWFEAEGLVMPEIAGSSEQLGMADLGDGWQIPWHGNAIDQSAALLGQACTAPGEAKVTYGTCASFWYNTGHTYHPSKSMDGCVAWSVGAEPTYAIAGEAMSAGSSLSWLLQILKPSTLESPLSEPLAMYVDENGIFFVPALNGLGAPYWRSRAKGCVFGLTARTTPGELVRAALESVAYSVRDLLEYFMSSEGRLLPQELKVDGGMTRNDYLMQFQADILGRTLVVPKEREATSLGVAILAGATSGFYDGHEFIRTVWQQSRSFVPAYSEDKRHALYSGWKKAVRLTTEMYA